MNILGSLGNIGGKIVDGAKTVGGKVSSGLDTFKNRLSSTTSTVPSQYQFDKLGDVSSTIPSQYQFDNLGGTLYDGYDLGGQNAGKNTLSTTTPSKASDNFIKALAQQSTTQKSSGGSGYSPSGYNYEFAPSMVDYSQYIGLSPETQRYLYGGM